jgi:hypothetical protein
MVLAVLLYFAINYQGEKKSPADPTTAKAA